MYISERVFGSIASYTHKRTRLACNIEILLSVGFFLFEYQSSELPLLVYVSPSDTQYVRSTQTSETRKQERRLYLWVLTFRTHKTFYFINRKIHSRPLLCFESFNSAKRIMRNYTLFKSLIETSTKFIKIGHLAVTSE